VLRKLSWKLETTARKYLPTADPVRQKQQEIEQL